MALRGARKVGLIAENADRSLRFDPASGALQAVGDITMASANQWVRLFERALGALGSDRPQTTLAVDLTGVAHCDSAVMAVVAQWDVIAQAQGLALTTRNAPAGLRAIARLCEAGDAWGLDGR